MQAFKQRALKALREHRSIVAHYPDDKAAKAVVSFLSIVELGGKEGLNFTDEQAFETVSKIRDAMMEPLRGGRPDVELYERSKAIKDVLDAVLDG